MAKQGKGYWIDDPEKRKHPQGHDYYWLGFRWLEHEEDPQSDVDLMKNGYITAVPIKVSELTDHDFLQQHKHLFSDLFDELTAGEKEVDLEKERKEPIFQ